MSEDLPERTAGDRQPPLASAVSRALPVLDLEDRLRLGAERGEGLLHDHERAIVATILELDDDAALLHARLSGRKPTAFRMAGAATRSVARSAPRPRTTTSDPSPDATSREDLGSGALAGERWTIPGVVDAEVAAATLVARGLATHDVSWDLRCAHATREVLAAGCRRLGLPVGGSVDTLRDRLSGRHGWDDATWIGLTHKALVRRLEQWATLDAAPDRSETVLERMGLRKYVAYATTSGDAILPTRAAWDAWEALVAAWEDLDVDDALEVLGWDRWPPRRLDLRGAVAARLLLTVRAWERAGDLAAAGELASALIRLRAGGIDAVLRASRIREKQGDVAAALAVLTEAALSTVGPDRLALARAGRRVARTVGRAWPPEPPLTEPVARWITLERVPGAGPRPRYRVEGGPPEGLLVEDAVAARIRATGRKVIFTEGTLWHTVIGLLLADVMFLPVPGMLPVPRLAAPLDWGTVDFAARRAAAVWGVVDGLAAGEGPARVREAWDRYEGCAVAGVDWRIATRDDIVCAVEGLGASALLALVSAWLREGKGARAGLPDLCVLPGDGALSGTLPPLRVDATTLIEVKGETDALRDAQRAWIDRLARGAVAVEVWWISEGA